MEFCISPKASMFFTEVIVLTTIVFLMRVESQSAPVKNTLAEFSKTRPLKTLVFIPEWKRNAMRLTKKFLSPRTLSHVDLFQYLVREISEIPTRDGFELKLELESQLIANEISENVVPYVRALTTIIVAVNQLREAKRHMKVIRKIWRYAPSNISSPPGLSSYGFFSPDIFTDPDDPLPLLSKLIEIPESEVPNVIIQLQDYLKIWDDLSQPHNINDLSHFKWYAKNLDFFLKRHSTFFGDLKISVAEIQRISDSNRNSTVDGEMEDGTSRSTV